MKKVVLTLLAVFLLAGFAHAETKDITVNVTFSDAFKIGATTGPLDFGTIYLDGVDRVYNLDPTSWDSMADAKDAEAAAITAADTKVASSAVTKGGAPDDSITGETAGYLILETNVVDLNLGVNCDAIDGGGLALQKDGADTDVKLTQLYSSVDSINADAAIDTTNEKYIPLYIGADLTVPADTVSGAYTVDMTIKVISK